MQRMTMVAMAVATFAMTQIAFVSEDEANEGESQKLNIVLSFAR